MSDIFPQGTGCLIAIYIVFWCVVVGAIGTGIGYLIWGHA